MTASKLSVLGVLVIATLAFAWPARPAHAGKDKAETEPKAAGELSLLDEDQRARVGQTKALVVRSHAITKDPFASSLGTMCAQFSGWARGTPMPPEQIITLVTRRPLAERLAEAQGDVVATVTLARELADMFAGLRSICRHVVTGKLSAADLDLLRKDHANELGDALAQASQIEKKARQELVTLLEQAEPYADANAIEAAKPSLAPAASAFIETAQIERPGKSASALSLTSLGALGHTAFEGLAEFLVDRAKEEALAYVEEQLVERICAPNADPRVFIPTTCELLLSAESTLSLAAIGASLHASIVRDLALLADRSLVLAWTQVPDVAYAGTIIRVLLPLVRAARARTNPLEFAASLHASPAIDCETLAAPGHGSGDQTCADTMATLRLASMLTHAIASNSSMVALHGDPHYLTLAVAFTLEQRFAKLPEPAQQRLLAALGWTSFEIQPSHIANLNDSVTQLEGVIVDLERAIVERADAVADAGPILDTEMYGFAAVTTTQLALAGRHALGFLIAAAPSRSEGPEPPNQDRRASWMLELDAELAHANDYMDLARAFADQAWAPAAIATIEVTLALIERYEPAKSSEFVSLVSGVRLYIPLFIELANADSSDEINLALQAAFPAGGYKRKYRQGAVSINGLLGIYGGGTLSNQLSADDARSWSELGGEFAMFAPIGVHTTAPVGVNRERPWYLGALISVVDLGAITTSKWLAQESNDPVDTANGTSQAEIGEPAAFNLAGLLSPGAYFTVGIASSPFVLGAGVSLNPFAQKHTITARDSVGDIESIDKTLLPALRFGAFFAVDITFVSFGLRCGLRCRERR
jgi:hypothetical protein